MRSVTTHVKVHYNSDINGSRDSASTTCASESTFTRYPERSWTTKRQSKLSFHMDWMLVYPPARPAFERRKLVFWFRNGHVRTNTKMMCSASSTTPFKYWTMQLAPLTLSGVLPRQKRRMQSVRCILRLQNMASDRKNRATRQ
jgi:hypothetical protein